ncbi:MAG: helix-turn-helix domain-containing protein [Bacteroidota bacterium]
MQIIPIQLDSISNRLIRNAWVVEESDGIDIHVRAFPTGYPYINVISGTAFSIKDHKGNLLETTSYLSGNSVYPFDLDMRVIKRALTIQLQPYAIPYLTGIPANEFSELRVPIECFSTYLAERFEALINSDRTSQLVLGEVIKILHGQKPRAAIDKRVQVALEGILDTEGNISVNEINDRLNLSQRRLQQLFQKYLGLSAKSYSKVVRMQSHTFKLLNGKGLDSIVPDGYYDQSHFIHDVKKQTSMSPVAFQKFITSSEHHGAYYMSNLFYGTSQL